MDKIIIDGMRFYGYHGLLRGEKELGQPFRVDLEIELPLKGAGESDSIRQTVDYGEVYRRVKSIVEGKQFSLLESLAEAIAKNILQEYPVERVTIQVNKLCPPINGYLESVGVCITREAKQRMNVVYIGLGSNLGDRRVNLESALHYISCNPDITIEKISSFRQTKPVGYLKQPDFLNAVARLKTSLTPHQLLVFLQDIENKMKRVRTIRWGPRTIDLDILLFGEEIVNQEDLVIPHPRMKERRFVLEPLAEIAPTAIHPTSGRTATQLLEEINKSN